MYEYIWSIYEKHLFRIYVKYYHCSNSISDTSVKRILVVIVIKP